MFEGAIKKSVHNVLNDMNFMRQINDDLRARLSELIATGIVRQLIKQAMEDIISKMEFSYNMEDKTVQVKFKKEF